MIEELDEAMRAHGAAPLTHISFDGFTLSLSGEGWNGHTLCPWRITHGTEIVCGSETPGAEQAVARYLGDRVVGVRRQAVVSNADPTIELAGGSLIEVFSDVFTDSWVLGPHSAVHVGSPGDPRYSGLSAPADREALRDFGDGIDAAVLSSEERAVRISTERFILDSGPVWRLTHLGSLVASSGMPQPEAHLASLRTQRLLALGRQSTSTFGNDPCLHFTGGWAIEAFSDSDRPRWTLS